MLPAAIGRRLGIFGLLDVVTRGLFFATAIRPVGSKNLLLKGPFRFTPLFALFPSIDNFVRERAGLWSCSSS